jgi:hypothetical protein
VLLGYIYNIGEHLSIGLPSAEDGRKKLREERGKNDFAGGCGKSEKN